MVIPRESVGPNSYWRLPAPTMSSVPYAESAGTLLESSLGQKSHTVNLKIAAISVRFVIYISIILTIFIFNMVGQLCSFIFNSVWHLEAWVTALSGWENMLDILLYSWVLACQLPSHPSFDAMHVTPWQYWCATNGHTSKAGRNRRLFDIFHK